MLPSATELVCALGLRERLVAVSHECDFPLGVAALPHATRSNLPRDVETLREIDDAVRSTLADQSPLYGVDVDVLAATRPNVILTQGLCDVCAVSGATVAESLNCELPEDVREARVAALVGGDFEGITADVTLLGDMLDARPLDARPAAEALVADMRRRWAALSAASRLEPAPRVLVLEWCDPPFSGGHWIPEMVAQAGGVHLLGGPGDRSRTLTWAEVQAADPDVLVVANCGFGLADNDKWARRMLERADARRIRAVQERNLWVVDANAHFSRPSPRIVEGAEILAKILRGAAVDPMREARKI